MQMLYQNSSIAWSSALTSASPLWSLKNVKGVHFTDVQDLRSIWCDTISTRCWKIVEHINTQERTKHTRIAFASSTPWNSRFYLLPPHLHFMEPMP